MTLDDTANKVILPGHGQHPLAGPHSPIYHRYVLQQLTEATDGLSGTECQQARRGKLDQLGTELLQNSSMVKGIGLP